MTPGFTADEYEQRRSNLIKTLPEDSVVICLGYGTRYMTNNIFYPFHQNTDFWYLCGYNEPDAALILGNTNMKKRMICNIDRYILRAEKNKSKKGYKQTMFVLPKNAHAELWDGPRTGIEGAKEIFGADEAYENTKFIPYLKKVIGTYKHVFMDSPGNMPTLISDESTKNLIETGTFWGKLWFSLKKGHFPRIKHKKSKMLTSLPRPQDSKHIAIKQNSSRAENDQESKRDRSNETVWVDQFKGICRGNEVDKTRNNRSTTLGKV